MATVNHLTKETGPIVMEAHLVTQEEPAPYPASSTDELDAHYTLSQQKTIASSTQYDL